MRVVPDELRSAKRRRARHEMPAIPLRARLAASWLSYLWGTAWFVLSLVAFVVGFGLTGDPGTNHPPLLFRSHYLTRLQEPGMGAACVGIGAMCLVGVTGVLMTRLFRGRRSRRGPDLWSSGDHPARQVARRSWRTYLGLAGLIAFGLLLRHFYG
jgi:hypothetical protein